MRFVLSVLFFAFLTVSAFGQESGKYLKVERIYLSGKTFQMMNNSSKLEQIGGDSVAMDSINRSRDSTTTRQLPQRESQLEDRQFNNYDFERAAKTVDNQYINVSFHNLSGKEVKSVTFQMRLTLKGKSFFERNFKVKALQMQNGDFYVRDSFFSTTDLFKPNSEKEIVIKNIEFADGTKLKF